MVEAGTELTYEQMVEHVNERKGKRMKLTTDMSYARKEAENPVAPITGGIVEGASFEDEHFWIKLDTTSKSWENGEPFGSASKPKFIITNDTYNMHVGGLIDGAKWERYENIDGVIVLYQDRSYFVLIFLDPDNSRGTLIGYDGKPKATV